MAKATLKDMTGRRFKRLLVVSRAENDRRGGSRWNCVCDCGKTCIAGGTDLRLNRQVSCGCWKASPESKSWKTTNLLGKTFGRLTVINRELLPSKNRPYWLCECSCGKTKLVSSDCLLKGKTVSCGCKKVEECKLRSGPQNNFWNPSLTDEDRVGSRDSAVIHKFRKTVLERDGRVCCICLSEDKPVHVHHITPWKDNKALRSDPNNGIVMCVECHKEYHKAYRGRIGEVSVFEFLESKVCI